MKFYSATKRNQDKITDQTVHPRANNYINFFGVLFLFLITKDGEREKGRKKRRPIRLELSGHQNLDVLKKLGRTQSPACSCSIWTPGGDEGPGNAC